MAKITPIFGIEKKKCFKCGNMAKEYQQTLNGKVYCIQCFKERHQNCFLCNSEKISPDNLIKVDNKYYPVCGSCRTLIKTIVKNTSNLKLSITKRCQNCLKEFQTVRKDRKYCYECVPKYSKKRKRKITK